jgi:hypothetical protein
MGEVFVMRRKLTFFILKMKIKGRWWLKMLQMKSIEIILMAVTLLVGAFRSIIKFLGCVGRFRRKGGIFA